VAVVDSPSDHPAGLDGFRTMGGIARWITPVIRP
jgi:hypothetical protein